MTDTGLICPHCAETYKPNKLDFKRLPKTKPTTTSESMFFANGCSKCDETGVSALSTVTSICQSTDAIRTAVNSRSLHATQKAIAELQGSTSIAAQLQGLAQTGKINFEHWINQQ